VTASTTDTAPLLIGGELRPASGGATFDVLNPATEELIGRAADGTAADMDAAIAAAREAFDTTSWSTDHAFRASCLRQLRDALQSHTEELRALTIAEVGAPHMFTTGPQLDSSRGRPRLAGRSRGLLPVGRGAGRVRGDGHRSNRSARREAIGVVGAITPWNFPNQINLAKIGPALAAGCTVVLKPAPDTPLIAAAVARIAAEETDIPAGVLNVVSSSDHAVGAQLTSDPRVDLVSFTGSTATGKKIMAGRRGDAQEGLPRAGREVRRRGARRRRPERRLLHDRPQRVHPRRSGLRAHHAAGGAARAVRRGRPVRRAPWPRSHRATPPTPARSAGR
jgi:aldehyde dehydrogenase (NAD+)